MTKGRRSPVLSLSLAHCRSRDRRQRSTSPGPGSRGRLGAPSPALDLTYQQLEPAGTGSPHTSHLGGDSRLQNCSETRQREDAEDSGLSPRCTGVWRCRAGTPSFDRERCSSLRRHHRPVIPGPELTGRGSN